jgi:hypothetical protein
MELCLGDIDASFEEHAAVLESLRSEVREDAHLKHATVKMLASGVFDTQVRPRR